MSTEPAKEPLGETGPSAAVPMVIRGRPRDLGGFTVRRVLPTRQRPMVGPFVFWDHIGPAEFGVGQGIDVRPHPHINLSTVTYLFSGEIDHRDSLGTFQPIRPGEVNWMTAGRGITHSERTGPVARRSGSRLHGIQSWVGLPKAHEETEPAFHHYPESALPKLTLAGARLTVIAGSVHDVASPVETLSPTFFVDTVIDAGATLEVPTEYEERAAYVVEGDVVCDGVIYEPGSMLLLRPGVLARLSAREASRVMLLGGAPLDGERHIWWNLVSSSPDRIDRAKRDWKEGRFPRVPGDEVEFIPLPE